MSSSRSLKLKFLVLLNLAGCATNTQTENASHLAAETLAITGALTKSTPIAVAGPLRPFEFHKIPHQIQINGTILCSKNEFINNSQFLVELFNNDKFVISLRPDTMGFYNSKINTKPGTYQLRLLKKSNSEIVDQVEFTSTEELDRFTMNLKSCR